jgi:anthranilate phosphoribosyltransferase
MRHPLEALHGGDAAFNAAALRELLGGAPGAYRDAVLLNGAAALVVAGRAAGWHDGASQAARTIDDGAAADLLARWIAR